MPQFSKPSDFLVIGGGVIGLMTARELLAKGQSVAVIDRAKIGQESSWAGGGILFPVDPGQLPPEGMQLVNWSRKAYQALSQELFDETGIDSEWIQSGCIVKNLGQGDDIVNWTQLNGLSANLINKNQCKEIAPSLRENFGESVWIPEIAQIRNPRLLQALKKSVELNRGAIVENAPLEKINTKNGRAVCAICNGQEYQANQLILATGAWTSSLLQPIGKTPNIEPVRGQIICLKAQIDLLTQIVMEGNYYLIPRNDGRILAGSTVERVGFKKETTPEAFKVLRNAAITMVPELEHAEVEAHWAGLRPGSPEGIPTIAAHPDIENLYINAGHYRNGLVMAPASARLLTQMALDKEPIFNPAPFSLTN